MRYKCGHKPEPIIVSCSLITYVEYEDWAATTGFSGDKSECFDCYLKRTEESEKQ